MGFKQIGNGSLLNGDERINDLVASLAKTLDVKVFHFLSRPRCFAQKSEARFDRRIFLEATDIDPIGKPFPAIKRKQLFKDKFERQPMQGIVLLCGYGHVPKLRNRNEICGLIQLYVFNAENSGRL